MKQSWDALTRDRLALERIAAFLVEEILAMTDAEILSEEEEDRSIAKRLPPLQMLRDRAAHPAADGTCG